ncbi:SPASM domain-containing protein [Streptomyces sp. NPDC087850]|uniref:SPASM domain-containing protein n=1 Tax=unclassified Streptomyces TaxID=2593676 RepID=UPI003827A006
MQNGQRTEEAFRDLESLGLTNVSTDRTRAFGRGSLGARPTVDDLCGHCARGKVAIGPEGRVWPCVLGRFITLGNVKEQPLADIWASSGTAAARKAIEEAHADDLQSCTPPQFLPMCGPCGPCPPSFSACDPKTAEAGGEAATIGTPDPM